MKASFEPLIYAFVARHKHRSHEELFSIALSVYLQSGVHTEFRKRYEFLFSPPSTHMHALTLHHLRQWLHGCMQYSNTEGRTRDYLIVRMLDKFHRYGLLVLNREQRVDGKATADAEGDLAASESQKKAKSAWFFRPDYSLSFRMPVGHRPYPGKGAHKPRQYAAGTSHLKARPFMELHADVNQLMIQARLHGVGYKEVLEALPWTRPEFTTCSEYTPEVVALNKQQRAQRLATESLRTLKWTHALQDLAVPTLTYSFTLKPPASPLQPLQPG